MATTFTTTARVRYGETDKMGIVYHANYIIYFELGRTELMRAHGIDYAAMERDGQSLAVVDIAAHYHRPARYDDWLAIETRLTAASGVRLRFDYRVFQAASPDPAGNAAAGDLLCEGHTVLGCVSPAGRPTRIRSPWRERIDALLGADVPPTGHRPPCD